MAYVRKKPTSFKWPVIVKDPVDGGDFEESTFTATFKRMGRAEFSGLADKGDAALIEKLLLGWSDINDEDGKPVPFTKENLKAQCDDGYWMRAVISAYSSTFDGARAGN
jgi:hypothetical protein